MRHFRWILSVFVAASLLGCASNGQSNNSEKSRWSYPPMAVPLQPSIQQELQLARLNQLLMQQNIDDETRAKMFAERGRYLDSVGLRDLARVDYERSLQLQPAQPDIYNLLGVFFSNISEFDAAFDAFDSSLELDPNNEYALRNRAIALYYAERNSLALEDITQSFTDDPLNPYNALWLYYIAEQNDVVQARDDLMTRYQNRNDDWGWILVGVTLGQVSENELFNDIGQGARDNTLLAQKLTEAYFYLGKMYQQQGNYIDAIAVYKLAISLNVYDFSEHGYAFLELRSIFKQIQEQHANQTEDNK